MQNVLQVGANQHQGMNSTGQAGWRSMDSAPRDGTVVELMCTYGVAPWYGLFKWTSEQKARTQNGELVSFPSDKHRWVRATDEASSVDGEGTLKWRPYSGDITHYSDPTGGMQNDMAYWRGAVASKYGLPLDHFEKDAERNRKRNAKKDAVPQQKTMLEKIRSFFSAD